MISHLDKQKKVLELERMELENEKLKLERDRLKSEHSVLKQWVIPLATPISILVTVLITVFTWNNNIALQQTQAQTEFELRIADEILNADTPAFARNRARAILRLFPDRFTPAFAELLETLKPEDYVTGYSEETLIAERRLNVEARLEMLRIINEYGMPSVLTAYQSVSASGLNSAELLNTAVPSDFLSQTLPIDLSGGSNAQVVPGAATPTATVAVP